MAERTVHQLRVTLRDVTPPVWRRVVVAADTPLSMLSDMLEAAMVWQGGHLHAFNAGGRGMARRSVLWCVGVALLATGLAGCGDPETRVGGVAFPAGSESAAALPKGWSQRVDQFGSVAVASVVVAVSGYGYREDGGIDQPWIAAIDSESGVAVPVASPPVDGVYAAHHAAALEDVVVTTGEVCEGPPLEENSGCEGSRLGSWAWDTVSGTWTELGFAPETAGEEGLAGWLTPSAGTLDYWVWLTNRGDGRAPPTNRLVRFTLEGPQWVGPFEMPEVEGLVTRRPCRAAGFTYAIYSPALTDPVPPSSGTPVTTLPSSPRLVMRFGEDGTATKIDLPASNQPLLGSGAEIACTDTDVYVVSAVEDDSEVSGLVRLEGTSWARVELDLPRGVYNALATDGPESVIFTWKSRETADNIRLREVVVVDRSGARRLGVIDDSSQTLVNRPSGKEIVVLARASEDADEVNVTDVWKRTS